MSVALLFQLNLEVMMLKKINELKAAITSVAALIALAFVAHGTYAKEEEFQSFKAEIRFDKEKARRKELREIIFECQTKYANTDNAFIIKACRDAEIELEESNDKGG